MSTLEFFRWLKDSSWVKMARIGMLYLYLPTSLKILSSPLSLIVTHSDWGVSVYNCINSGWLSEQSWRKTHIVMSFYNFVSVPLGTSTLFFVKKPRHNEQMICFYLFMRQEKKYNSLYFWNIGAEQKFGIVKTKYDSSSCIHPCCVYAVASTPGFWSFLGHRELKC